MEPVNVPLTRPSIDRRDRENVHAVLESGQLVQGSRVAALEKAVAAMIGVDHAVAVSSGTATLHLALLSFGTGPGDEVIVPAFSHVATANAVELTGAKPVFVDIDPGSLNIQPDGIVPAISRHTKVLMPVHEFGVPADMGKILEIAESHHLPVVEDAACALGSEWSGKKVGCFGAAGSFSLHPRKAVTSGEGGVLTTNDSGRASFFRIMRNHGMDDSGRTPDFVRAGFNYRMTDIQAALVLGQIERLETLIARRRAVAERYDRELHGRFFRKPPFPAKGRTNWQSYHIVLDDAVEQPEFLAFLREKGIGANYGAQCIPLQTYYRRKYGYAAGDFPEAYRAFRRGVVLPLYDSMSERQIAHVIECVNGYRS